MLIGRTGATVTALTVTQSIKTLLQAVRERERYPSLQQNFSANVNIFIVVRSLAHCKAGPY